MTDWIPLNGLEERYASLTPNGLYELLSRNLELGVWHAQLGAFWGIRRKFAFCYTTFEHNTVRSARFLNETMPFEIVPDSTEFTEWMLEAGPRHNIEDYREFWAKMLLEKDEEK